MEPSEGSRSCQRGEEAADHRECDDMDGVHQHVENLPPAHVLGLMVRQKPSPSHKNNDKANKKRNDSANDQLSKGCRIRHGLAHVLTGIIAA